MSLPDLTALETAAAVREGHVSAVDVVEAALDRIAALDGDLNALLRVDAEDARQSAATIERRLADGEDPGPLAGVPLVVKDNLAVRGCPLTCASRILDGHVAAETAPAVARALAAGAVLVGAANLDEFGMGSSGETSAFPPTRNPWDRDRVPGGSSSGAAAAVAARLVPLALGTDTGGSVRLPAALCGVVGLRPTYGRVSRRGLVAFASSLDQIGPIARTVRDAAALLRAIAGVDVGDATSVDRPLPPVPDEGPIRLDDVRLGFAPQLVPEDLDEGVGIAFEASLETFRKLGAEIVEVGLPSARHALAAYYLVADAEASSNLARYDGVRYGLRVEGDDPTAETRGEGFGREVRRRILLGTLALSAGRREDLYGRATRLRVRLRREAEEALGRVDALVSPTSPEAAFPRGERLDDPLRMYHCDVLTVPASLAGLPALSVPCGFTEEGLPVGLQITGSPWREDRVLEIAAAFEDVTGFHRSTPEVAR